MFCYISFVLFNFFPPQKVAKSAYTISNILVICIKYSIELKFESCLKADFVKCSPFASLGHAAGNLYGCKRSGVCILWARFAEAKPNKYLKLKNINFDKLKNFSKLIKALFCHCLVFLLTFLSPKH